MMRAHKDHADRPALDGDEGRGAPGKRALAASRTGAVRSELLTSSQREMFTLQSAAARDRMVDPFTQMVQFGDAATQVKSSNGGAVQLQAPDATRLSAASPARDAAAQLAELESITERMLALGPSIA